MPTTLISTRPLERKFLGVVAAVMLLGFSMVHIAERLYLDEGLFAFAGRTFIPPLVLLGWLFAVHLVLSFRGVSAEQLILPLTGLLVGVGLFMIHRLWPGDPAFSFPPTGIWQQLILGVSGGMTVILLLNIYPYLVELLRRSFDEWLPLIICMGGLGLLFATALFGEEIGGVRLAIRLGGFSVQTSEIIKLSLIIFLAWYGDIAGQSAEFTYMRFGFLRLPQMQTILPSLMFIMLAMVALLLMSDWGAILILMSIFAAILYTAFEQRIFYSMAGLGLLVLAVAVAGIIWLDAVPGTVALRWTVFRDPWSEELVSWFGTPTAIVDGPGYQTQQAIYAVIAGGLLGSGLGFGAPNNIPLPFSDFIFAAIIEEMGLIIGMALLVFYIILVWRILRVAAMLPEALIFERLLLIGIAVHLCAQTFVITGGTFALIPLTGLTAPFLSLGGMAMLINLTEIGIVLALAQRLPQQALAQ